MWYTFVGWWRLSWGISFWPRLALNSANKPARPSVVFYVSKSISRLCAKRNAKTKSVFPDECVENEPHLQMYCARFRVSPPILRANLFCIVCASGRGFEVVIWSVDECTFVHLNAQVQLSNNPSGQTRLVHASPSCPTANDSQYTSNCGSETVFDHYWIGSKTVTCLFFIVAQRFRHVELI